jgi:rRNA maturation endonuclease Nob1
MALSSYVGFKCPRCHSTVDIGVTSGHPACTSCGTAMVQNENAPGAAANIYCRTCNAAFGLVNSDRCPECGGPFSARP